MLSHIGVWAAIDALAERAGLSPSALARRAGLDPTTFNRSKRVAPDGRPRWPSTESIAKVLQATGASLKEFSALMESREAVVVEPLRAVPLVGFAQAGAKGYFDGEGFPLGQVLDDLPVPRRRGEEVYALEVRGDSMLPVYRHGDRIIVSAGVPCRRGDRVVVRTRAGEVMAKVLERRSAGRIELRSLNPEHEDRAFSLDEIEWMARIVWASQ